MKLVTSVRSLDCTFNSTDGSATVILDFGSSSGGFHCLLELVGNLPVSFGEQGNKSLHLGTFLCCKCQFIAASVLALLRVKSFVLVTFLKSCSLGKYEIKVILSFVPYVPLTPKNKVSKPGTATLTISFIENSTHKANERFLRLFAEH